MNEISDWIVLQYLPVKPARQIQKSLLGSAVPLFSHLIGLVVVVLVVVEVRVVPVVTVVEVGSVEVTAEIPVVLSSGVTVVPAVFGDLFQYKCSIHFNKENDLRKYSIK